MSTFTPQTRNSSTFTGESKSTSGNTFLLLEDGFYLLLEDGFKLILEQSNSTIAVFTNEIRN